MSESRYQLIKRSIADGISTQRYLPGQVLPSEPALCRTFGVARMTVNRAMRELAAEQLVRRVPGVGTFVAEPVAQSGLVELRNIADEIAERGHRHSATVFVLAAVTPDEEQRAIFDIAEGLLFHSAILHCENEAPIQFEDRFVAPAVAPDYLRQDFSRMTPSEYLLRVAPVQEVRHDVQATATPRGIARHLDDKICLLVTRRTWSGGRLATLTRLYYPGSRFRLTERFVPN
jgi:GntR family histidine utilization transcriptional repressor